MIQSSKNNSNLQHILFSKEQYQELLRLFSLYALVKQKSPTPLLTTEEFGDYIYKQGGKFGFEKSKMDDMDWFEKINNDVFESLFHYSQHEAWEHLANRLAHRDATEASNNTNSIMDKEMKEELFLDIMAKRLEFYLDEFSKNGIKNLRLNH